MNRQLVCPVVSAPAVMWAVAAPLGSEMVPSGERRGYHSPLPSTSRNSQYAIEKEIFLGGWNCLSPQTTHTKKSILWNINLLTYFTGLDNKTEKPDKTDLANGGGKTLWFHCQKCQFSSSLGWRRWRRWQYISVGVDIFAVSVEHHRSRVTLITSAYLHLVSSFSGQLLS